MRVPAISALVLLPLAASAATPVEEAPAAGSAVVPAEPAESLDRMNVYRVRPDCVSIPQQVAGEDREYDATRLDRLPPGKLLLAVEREVGGCPEAVLASEERRRQTGRARPGR